MDVPSDCTTVQQFWRQLGSPNVLNQTNCCSTAGISCQNGSITSLVSKGSNGIIPTAISQLSKLELLDLTNGSLTGSIPPDLGKLKSLKDLWLDGNQLNGSIPTELGGLVRLNKLFLSSNNLTGNIPRALGSLSELFTLALSTNSLSGQIPSELSKLAGLGALELQNNQLSGPIPKELGNLKRLIVLNLNGNQDLKGPIPNEWSLLSFGDSKCDLGNLCSNNGTSRPIGCGTSVVCPVISMTESLSSGAIAGIIIGTVILCISVVFLVKRHKKSPDPRKETPQSDFVAGSKEEFEPVNYTAGSGTMADLVSPQDFAQTRLDFVAGSDTVFQTVEEWNASAPSSKH